MSDTTRQYVTRRPLTERELKIVIAALNKPVSTSRIVRAAIKTPVSTSTLAITSTNTMTCPKCGAFEKSGRLSCCAPGGAWYKNCGGAGNRNAFYRWVDGIAACKCKSKNVKYRSSCSSSYDCFHFFSFSLFFTLHVDECLHVHTSHDNDCRSCMPQMRHHGEI